MKPFQVLLVALTFLLTAPSLLAQDLYRYRDENGVTHMGPTIPAQYVDKGYDVLNAQGMLIRHVPAKEPEAKKANQVNPDQQKADEILLSSYSNVDEIAAHRDRRLAGVQRQIEITMSDRHVLNDELDKVTKSASKYKTQGKDVPKDISDRIDELNRMVKSLDKQLVQQAQEKQDINEEFAAKIKRFQQIKPANTNDN